MCKLNMAPFAYGNIIKNYGIKFKGVTCFVFSHISEPFSLKEHLLSRYKATEFCWKLQSLPCGKENESKLTCC